MSHLYRLTEVRAVEVEKWLKTLALAKRHQGQNQEGRAGASAPRQHESYDRRLHAGGQYQKREAQSKLVRMVLKKAAAQGQVDHIGP